MWQWELLSTRGQTMPTKRLISFLKHFSSPVVEIECVFFFPEFFFFFFLAHHFMYSIPDCPWALQVSGWSHKIHYSSLVLEKYAAIMNIMTVFVYRAGRKDIKVSLLMMNIKEMSVFRDEGNYVYWRLKTNFFNVCNSWNDPARCVEEGIVERSQQEMAW